MVKIFKKQNFSWILSILKIKEYLNILEYSTKHIEHIYYFNSIDPHEKIYQYPTR